MFALLFKWQSYNSRLILPLMIAVGPLAGWVSDAIRPRIVIAIIAALFTIGGLRICWPILPVRSSVLVKTRVYYWHPERRSCSIIHQKFVMTISQLSRLQRTMIVVQLDWNWIRIRRNTLSGISLPRTICRSIKLKTYHLLQKPAAWVIQLIVPVWLFAIYVH